MHFFGRIGTFQRVTRKKNKKIQRHLNSPIRLRNNGLRRNIRLIAKLRPSSCIFGHPSKEESFIDHANSASATLYRKQGVPRLFLRLRRIALSSGIGNIMSVFLKFPRPVRMLGSVLVRPRDASCSRAPGAFRSASSEPRQKPDRARASAKILNDCKMVRVHSGVRGAYYRISRRVYALFSCN